MMTTPTNGRAIEILLIEDSPGDVRLTLESLKGSKVRNRVNVVPDGVEALAYLRGENGYAQSPRPDLIVLDLNLPKKDGREVLSDIKGDAELKRIPVVVLTSSRADEDILRTYSLHANCYISKPVTLEQFMGVVRAIEDFWLTVVRLPPE